MQHKYRSNAGRRLHLIASQLCLAVETRQRFFYVLLCVECVIEDVEHFAVLGNDKGLASW